MRRFLFSVVIACVALFAAPPARAQQVTSRPAKLTRAVIYDVQTASGAAADSGQIPVAGCRMIYVGLMNTGTAATPAGQVFQTVGITELGTVTGVNQTQVIPAGGAFIMQLSGMQPGIIVADSIRVTFAATANAAPRVIVYCVK